jgi:uncharacterized integral membrane protein
MLRDEPDVPKDKSVPPASGVPAPGETEDQLHEIQRARRARVAKVLLGLAIVVVLIIFIISNSQHVPVDFVFFTRHPRLIWVMFACTVLGGLVGYLIGRPGRQVRMRHRHGEEQNRDR